jgi:hypothetical protein
VWAYAGHESTLGPVLLATVFGIANVVLVVSTLDGRRRWIAGSLVLAASTYLTQISSQCADVPLAGFIVATLVVACGDGLRWRNARSRAFVAGALSAMAAWTKNEGLVFALLMLIAAVVVAVRASTRGGNDAPRRVLDVWWAIAGAAPVVIAIAWFKLAVAPESGLVEGQSAGVFATRLLDLDRHVMVMTLMAQHAVRWSAPMAVAIFPLAGLAAIWTAVRGDVPVRIMAAVLGLMLVSYYLVYVTTPFDIAWHVSTSIDRLLVQLWPSLVLTMFLGFESGRRAS